MVSIFCSVYFEENAYWSGEDIFYQRDVDMIWMKRKYS